MQSASSGPLQCSVAIMPRPSSAIFSGQHSFRASAQHKPWCHMGTRALYGTAAAEGQALAARVRRHRRT